MNSDIEPADKFTAARADASNYDGLILPGGTVNADKLRIDPDVQRFVFDIFKSGKPSG